MRERPLAVGGALRLRLEAKRPKAQSKLGLKAGKIEGEKMEKDRRWEGGKPKSSKLKIRRFLED